MKRNEIVCRECNHNRVCGNKERYKMYFEELQELNKKYVISDNDFICPEFQDKDEVNAGLELLEREAETIEEDKDDFEIDEIMKIIDKIANEEAKKQQAKDMEDLAKEEGTIKDDEEFDKFLDEMSEMIIDFIEKDTPLDDVLFPNTTKEVRQVIRAKVVEESLLEISKLF